MSTQETTVPIFGIDFTTAIVAAYVSNPQHHISQDQLAGLVKSVHVTVIGLGTGHELEEQRKPAVPVKKSVQDSFLVCLEDGKQLKMLKRYLRTNYDLTPEEYRARWGLPHDYPMVAPEYARQRSDFAKKSGLGRSRPKGKRR